MGKEGPCEPYEVEVKWWQVNVGNRQERLDGASNWFTRLLHRGLLNMANSSLREAQRLLNDCIERNTPKLETEDSE